MEKVLVISDIHANLEALKAVLNENFDFLVVLGDLTDYGPSPNEVMDLIRAKSKHAIMGNHDFANAFKFDCFCSYEFKEYSTKTREYFRPKISEENMKFLKTLPLDLKIKINGQDWYVVHAAPSDKLYKYLSADASNEDFEKEIKLARTNNLMIGHTHRQFLKTGSFTIFNPGSVGQPRDGDWRASYAIITDHVELKRVEYDVDTTISKIAETELEQNVKDKLIEVLKNGK